MRGGGEHSHGRQHKEQRAQHQTHPVQHHGGKLPVVADVILLVLFPEASGDLTEFSQDAVHVIGGGARQSGVLSLGEGGRGIYKLKYRQKDAQTQTIIQYISDVRFRPEVV